MCVRLVRWRSSKVKRRESSWCLQFGAAAIMILTNSSTWALLGMKRYLLPTHAHTLCSYIQNTILTHSLLLQRFNVAVTRAKALLIVVGNPRVLNTDPIWNRYVSHGCFCFLLSRHTYSILINIKFKRAVPVNVDIVLLLPARLQLHPVL